MKGCYKINQLSEKSDVQLLMKAGVIEFRSNSRCQAEMILIMGDESKDKISLERFGLGRVSEAAEDGNKTLIWKY